jgi:hypothetical protein
MRGATYTPFDAEVEQPEEKPAEKPRVRARNKKGHFQADDPATPENEAWEEPKE